MVAASKKFLDLKAVSNTAPAGRMHRSFEVILPHLGAAKSFYCNRDYKTLILLS
jgi:hypothetical protein